MELTQVQTEFTEESPRHMNENYPTWSSDHSELLCQITEMKRLNYNQLRDFCAYTRCPGRSRLLIKAKILRNELDQESYKKLIKEQKEKEYEWIKEYNNLYKKYMYTDIVKKAITYTKQYKDYYDRIVSELNKNKEDFNIIYSILDEFFTLHNRKIDDVLGYKY